MLLTALMPGLGAVWSSLGDAERLDTFRLQGILPILRRIVIVGEPGPFSANVSIRYSGTWRLAREDGGDRIFLNMWLDALAPRASTFGPTPGPDAERILVGRVFAEHVVTRPFAPASERKVTRLEVPGIPSVPEDVFPFEEAEALVADRVLEPAGDHPFGMKHTDSNQHVNSLVYPRLFEEAVLRRHGNPALLARALEIRYRKPFFAGDRAALAIAVDGTTAFGAFAPTEGAKPSCTIAMRLA